jgi:hypothetical protein
MRSTELRTVLSASSGAMVLRLQSIANSAVAASVLAKVVRLSENTKRPMETVSTTLLRSPVSHSSGPRAPTVTATVTVTVPPNNSLPLAPLRWPFF